MTPPTTSRAHEASEAELALLHAEVNLTATELADKYGSQDSWGRHPSHARSDWQAEVANGDTQSGYWDWVVSQISMRADELDLPRAAAPGMAPRPKVLVQVSGGVAEIATEGGVDTLLVDRDNLEDGELLVAGESWASVLWSIRNTPGVVILPDDELDSVRECFVTLSKTRDPLDAQAAGSTHVSRALYLPSVDELVLAKHPLTQAGDEVWLTRIEVLATRPAHAASALQPHEPLGTEKNARGFEVQPFGSDVPYLAIRLDQCPENRELLRRTFEDATQSVESTSAAHHERQR